MRLFLTSSPCIPCPPGPVQIPCVWNRENGFVERMKEGWRENSRCLIICADPENAPLNDEMRDTFEKAFRYDGMTVSEVALCDARNRQEIGSLMESADVIILGGGHVPTQNEFFRSLNLKERIRNFDGIVMGISAGTMNCAETVYAQPELEGEAIDPDYRRFIEGLGLTDVNVLPHYQMVKDNVLDGKRLMEEITYPDSEGHTFYALVDGSYVEVCGGRTVLRGEAYRIRDGHFEQISSLGGTVDLTPQDNSWLRWAVELQALAQAGLYYCKDQYEIERYERVREIAAEMIAHRTGLPGEKVRDLFCNEFGYQTPKLDTRAAIFRDDKILLVKENNGTWSLPGGWVDVDLSVEENTVKEVKEEAGLDVTASRIIAVQDREKHNLPVYAYKICKIFVLCTVRGGAFRPNSETVESRYFGLDELPLLAEEKNNEEQIRMCFDAYRAEHWETVFD